MSLITFTKMHGLGNNYIYIDCFIHDLVEKSLPQLAQKLSNVATGIGSDGMILICPSKKCAAKMRIFNKDGSEATNCGNGLRCVAKYIYDKQYVNQSTFQIETVSGCVEATIIENTSSHALIQVNMGYPKLLRNLIPMLGGEGPVINEAFHIAGSTYYVTAVSMGNPHVVLLVETVDNQLISYLGPLIENDLRFPRGANVEFVQVLNRTNLVCRVWERGSGITQACGTGACAAVVAAVLNAKVSQNNHINVHLEGGTLVVNWSNDGDVIMTGPAVTVAQGEVLHTSSYLVPIKV
jgi:diaminopimelate epimerase